jgi:hypothetical protein
MTFDSLISILTPVFQASATIIGLILARRLATPKDHERAALLATIAKAAVALVVSRNAGASWSQLLDLVVREIIEAAGVPTSNAGAIRRAAASALHEAGIRPGA